MSSISFARGATAVALLTAALMTPAAGWTEEPDWNVERLDTCAESLDSPNLESVRPPPDPTGVWAQRTTLTGLSKVPVVGNVTSVTTTYQLVTIEQRGDSDSDIRMTGQVCDVNLRNNSSLVDPEIPESFVRSLAKTVRPGELVRRTDGWWLDMARHTQVIGANLGHPPHDSLPTTPDDPRVYDQDSDGKPGITIRVRGIVKGELYLVQRGIDAWRARFQTRDKLKGCVDWSQTQRVLESNSIFLGDGPSTRQHPDFRRSTVTLRRLGGSDATCNDVQNAFQ